MKTISLADETRLYAFLLRAGTALLASGWQPGSLGLLDWHRADGVNPAHRVEHPELGALADEFYAPGEFDGTVTTLAEAYLAAVKANDKGKVEFHFRTFAKDETSYWDISGTPLAALAPFPIFGLYMIREGDPTRYGAFLDNIFCYPELPDDAPKDQYGRNQIEAFFDSFEGGRMEHEGDGVEFVTSVDPDKMDGDPRFSDRVTFEVNAGELTFTTGVMEALARVNAWNYEDSARDAIMEQLADQATEDALEFFQGNAYHPKAVLAA